MLRRQSRQLFTTIQKRSKSTNLTSESEKSTDLPKPKPVSQIIQNPTNVPQAPNRNEIWSESQRPSSEAFAGPRFVQRDFDRQPQPYAAIELIAKEPVRYVHDHTAVCDGGSGAQGHPKIFINVDKPGSHPCLYCGLRFAHESHKEHVEAESA